MTNEINATIARAMGWRLDYDGGHWQFWISPEGKSVSVRPSCNEYPAGDFTRDAAASRQMVEWIASDEVRWIKFDLALEDAIYVPASQKWYTSVTALTLEQWRVKAKLTAPLETLARAAVQAIGGKGNE